MSDGRDLSRAAGILIAIGLRLLAEESGEESGEEDNDDNGRLREGLD
ncbi:MAG: hypothetical protein ACLPKZ_01495 [Acidimicrobiales bacterium]